MKEFGVYLYHLLAFVCSFIASRWILKRYPYRKTQMASLTICILMIAVLSGYFLFNIPIVLVGDPVDHRNQWAVFVYIIAFLLAFMKFLYVSFKRMPKEENKPKDVM